MLCAQYGRHRSERNERLRVSIGPLLDITLVIVIIAVFISQDNRIVL
jgi:hypothetical protein